MRPQALHRVLMHVPGGGAAGSHDQVDLQRLRDDLAAVV